jgi:hypothetical protein
MPFDNNNNLDLTTFSIGNRRLWRHEQNWTDVGSGSLSLESVRDKLRKQHENQRPGSADQWDFVHELRKVRVHFTSKGFPFLEFIGRTKVPVLLTKRGWDALMGFVCPARLKDWKHLSTMSEVGAKITSAAINTLIQQIDVDLFFRTGLTSIKNADGTSRVVPILRSVQSASQRGYTVLDNLTLVEQALVVPKYANAPVLECTIEDESFRLRFADIPIDQMMELNKQYGITDLINSEVGLGRWVSRGGTYKPWCTNGCASTTTEYETSGIHRGSHDRIMDALLNGMHGIQSAQQEVVSLYNKATETEVDNLIALMDLEFEALAKESTRFKTTQREKDLIYEALNHETTSDNKLVAAGTDAITFVANALPLNRAYDLEQMGFAFMRNSVRKSVNNRITITV